MTNAVSSRIAETASDSRPDGELVEAARSGSAQAFGKLVERCQTLVSALAYSLTGSISHSEEIAQEVFLVAWRGLPEMRKPESFRAWIYGITQNLSRQFCRKQSLRRSLQSRQLAMVSES